jgi:hypothetical protein
MADNEQPTPPPLIDNPFAPEFFADEATGFFIHQGNISITFSAARVDHRADPAPVSRVVVARVILPLPAVAALAANLPIVLRQLGIAPQVATGAGQPTH